MDKTLFFLAQILITGGLTAVITSYVKSQFEKFNKLIEENSSLKFAAVHNKIDSVDNKVVACNNELDLVKKVSYRTNDSVHDLDKRVSIIITKQEYVEKRMDSILAEKIHKENFGKVIVKGD